jgi:hypothetical protein
MSSLSRRACFKCGNVGHYAGKLRLCIGCVACCTKTLSEATVASGRFRQRYLHRVARAMQNKLHGQATDVNM